MFDSIERAAAALRAGTVSAAALIDASLDAIGRRNAETRAFISVDASGARAQALIVDAERARGIDRGPLHGIPVSLKDLIDVSGVVTTAGSHVLDDRIAPSDAAVVTRLRASGAIVIGRTNLHQFALGTTSDDSAFGAVCHPGDRTRVAGGSSGGSAVAVATGMGLASIGTDTGGSVRIPAAACGVVGLKPSHGEVPTTGVVPLCPSLDHVGPLARTVQDAAWMLAVLSGRTPATVQAIPVKRLRIRRLGGYFESTLDAGVQHAFDAALERLRSGGATVLDGDMPSPERIADAYVPIVLAEGAHVHARTLDAKAALYSPVVRARLLGGRQFTAVAYLQARESCVALRAEVDALLDGCDVLALPTLPIRAPRLGQEDLSDPRTGATISVRAAMLKHTQLFNMTGHPAVSLPTETSGLPVGMQLVGRLNDTDALLRAALTCERTVGGAA